MKRYVFIFCLLICGNDLIAQNIRIEAIAGFNASQIDGDNLAGFNKPGLLFGGGAGIPLRENFQAQARLLFSQRGSRSSENDPLYQVNRLTYLDFPFVLEFEPKDDIFLEAGFQVSYLISAKIDDGFGFDQQREQFKSTPYAFIIGGAYEYEQFKFRLNYQRSLNYITKFPGYLDRTISLTVALRL